jgi:Fe2+ transport system protein FeoA
MQKSNQISLSSASRGQLMKIVSMPDGVLKAQFVRLGIREGEKVKCLERLPGGTVVLQKSRQQISIGHQIAKQIMVVILNESKK